MRPSALVSMTTGRSLLGAAALIILLTLSGCGIEGGEVSNDVVPPFAARFLVKDAIGQTVAGATVYLVPASDVDQSPITGMQVRDGSAENRDEPLEDLIRTNGATYPQAVTDANGVAVVPNVADRQYFCFVQPAAGDVEHLPGGSGCRLAVGGVALRSTAPEIILSSNPPAGTGYMGSTGCMICHSDLITFRTHAHRLGLATPGSPSGLQDEGRYPGYRDGWNQFLPAADYTGGTVVWFHDFDPGRPGPDKFRTSLTDPTIANPLAVAFVKAYLWRSGSTFKVTLENVHTPPGVPGVGDPPNLWTLDVALTYGGALGRQVNLLSIPGRQGRYPFLQFQTEGDDTRYERTRKVYRDYHLDYFWNDAAKTFRFPDPATTFEGNCTACHVTGFERYQDGGTNEWLTRGVDDGSGAFDLDGDGNPDEVNIGCEVCHGPGLAHANWAVRNPGSEPRYIVQPQHLGPGRQLLLCGRCHDGSTGAGSLANEEPLSAGDAMVPPGLSRADYLALHTSIKGPTSDKLWSDEVYSRADHQQYADLLKSTKHRNDRYLVVCGDCHESHGKGMFRSHLRWDPDDSAATGLCFRCHGVDLETHALDAVGFAHAGIPLDCVQCHQPGTAQGGAGEFGILLGPLTGGPGDDALIYYHNDLHSHVYTAPRRTHPSVVGVQPVDAMPIPFTNSCGTPCHAASLPLSHQSLAPFAETGPSQANKK